MKTSDLVVGRVYKLRGMVEPWTLVSSERQQTWGGATRYVHTFSGKPLYYNTSQKTRRVSSRAIDREFDEHDAENYARALTQRVARKKFTDVYEPVHLAFHKILQEWREVLPVKSTSHWNYDYSEEAKQKRNEVANNLRDAPLEGTERDLKFYLLNKLHTLVEEALIAMDEELMNEDS